MTAYASAAITSRTSAPGKLTGTRCGTFCTASESEMEPQKRKANDLPWAESKVTPEKPAANKCPTCGRGYRKKRKATTNGPTPLEAYIEEQKKKEEGRPYDDDLPW